MAKDIAGLSPQMPFCAAAAPVILPRLHDVFAHEEGTRHGDDIEQLHDMRVASRRLRAAMDIFRPCFPRRPYKPLRTLAAGLTKALGAVRDRDVLLEALEGYGADLPADERHGVEDLMMSLRRERETARVSMIQALDEVKTEGFRQRLHQLAEEVDRRERRESKPATAEGSLRGRAQRIGVLHIAELYGYAHVVHDPARVEELHEMRIAAKHLRYSLEIFRSCLGPEVEACIEAIKEIQEQIGAIHDCDVLLELTRSHLAVVAQREHERLVDLASRPVPHEDRLAAIRSALQVDLDADPRLGLLSLLGRKLDERAARHTEFARWWDAQESHGLRTQLYACLTTPEDVAQEKVSA